MAKAESSETDAESRPIRRAVIAETGRQLLDRLNISQTKVVRETSTGPKKKKKALNRKKRQMSERSQRANEPATTKVQKLKVDPDQARKPGVIPKMWTPEEDQLLQRAIAKHGERNWRAIADLVPGRSYIQCLQRWKKALRPGLRKGHWSKEEDATLLKLVDQYKPDWDWSLISKQIPGRNAKQCRERWFLNLDPSINRGPWTPEEDEQLLNFVAQLGGRWALISKHMEGRTENSVKTRFHSLQRKEARNRKWSKEEDDKIIEAVLKFGREFDKIDSLIKGRTKGQIKKRFSILTQQKPDLIRNVYAVEESIRQRKAAEAMANAPNSLQNYPSSFLNPAPAFARARLGRQPSFSTEPTLLSQSSWLNTLPDSIKASPVPGSGHVSGARPGSSPPVPGQRVSNLKKTHSTRVIEDILKPNRIIEESRNKNTNGKTLPPQQVDNPANTLQRWSSSGLSRFMSNGTGMSLQGLNQTLSIGAAATSPPKPPTRASPNMAALDKLFDETKSNHTTPTPTPSAQQAASPGMTGAAQQYSQSFSSPNALMYNPASRMGQDGILKRNSTFGVDQALAMPQYDTNSSLFVNANSIPKRPLQRAGNSLGSVGLATYDSSDMKNFLNLL